LATIREVALAAGVSIATVSRVFNKNTPVNPDTAERVLQVAGRLDYWPNSAAQGLATRCTRTFGVMLPDLFGEFYSDVIRGIDQQARVHQYQILLSSSHSNSEDVLSASRAMLGRIDGLILMAPDESSHEIVERVRRRVPVVLLSPRTRVDDCHSVGIDNFCGAKEAVAHLVSLGHRQVAFITGPEGNVDAEERLRGFRQALTEAGRDTDEALVIPGDFHESAGFDACSTILEHSPRPTAVFAANDSMAIGLLAALQRRGCRVPEDIAVVGFDNVAIAGYLNPSLTTVNVDACGLGRQAVDLMLNAMEAKPGSDPVRQVIPAVLKVRRSCGAPSGADGESGAGSVLSMSPDFPRQEPKAANRGLTS